MGRQYYDDEFVLECIRHARNAGCIVGMFFGAISALTFCIVLWGFLWR